MPLLRPILFARRLPDQEMGGRCFFPQRKYPYFTFTVPFEKPPILFQNPPLFWQNSNDNLPSFSSWYIGWWESVQCIELINNFMLLPIWSPQLLVLLTQKQNDYGKLDLRELRGELRTLISNRSAFSASQNKSLGHSNASQDRKVI